MTYSPKPIDTSNITLTFEQKQLVEFLAKNTHDLWAQQRIDQGWQYGVPYNDAQKEHPNLVSYEDLPESEQQNYQDIASDIFTALLAKGHAVAKTHLFRDESGIEDSRTTLLLQQLQKSSSLQISSLLALYRETIQVRLNSPEVYQVLGQSFLDRGEPLIAYDILAEGLKFWEGDIRIQQLLALALARSGAIGRANDLLQNLVASEQTDEETLSILARTYKDLWQESISKGQQEYLRLAAQYYQQAYKVNHSSYPGINAAATVLLLGDRKEAEKIASSVREECFRKLPVFENRTSQDYWLLATLGEAALILQNELEAQEFYTQAANVGQGCWGNIRSTRRNAKMICEYLKKDWQQVQKWLPMPKIAVFSGHMIDQPGRKIPRFPPQLELKVYESICDRLSSLDIQIGYASAACGADLLFLEALLEIKGEIHIVLPYSREQFIQDSVDFIPGSRWRERFEQVMAQATEVIIASKCKLEESTALYDYANCLLYGLGKMRAEQLDTTLIPLTVWDGQPGDGAGGTASTIEHWRKSEELVEIIELNPSKGQTSIRHLTQQPPQKKIESQQIMALLFADVVKYSQLQEDQIAPFVENFMGAIAQLQAESAYSSVIQETWGDAFHYVFPSIQDAGLFALDLCDLIDQTSWETKGLPKELTLRIALHAGPVYHYHNPVTRKNSYIGTHVTYGARIEPIAPPGKVYASQAFAALASSATVKGFICEYVGQLPLAKSYGTFPTYHVRRCY